MKSKKSRSKPSGKRGVKNLPPKKASDVKGGFMAVEHATLTGVRGRIEDDATKDLRGMVSKVEE